MKRIFQFMIFLLLVGVKDARSQVGINTISPTKALDVNGEMRVRMLPLGNISNSSLITVDTEGNLHTVSQINTNINKIGDVKLSLDEGDHNGWYMLDGRPLGNIPAVARTRATSLGLTSIPNFSDRIIKGKTASETTGLIGGTNTITLTQANMPLYNTPEVITSSGGSHTHTIRDEIAIICNNANGSCSPENMYRQEQIGSGGPQHSSQVIARTTSAGGATAHSHNVTASTGGAAIPFSILPEHIVVNTFIYLGE